jgi:hypothetical protein
MNRYLASVLLLVACGGTSGTKIRQQQLDQIVVGTTTWPEAGKILGTPQNLMESFNSTQNGYYSEKCGEEKAPIRVAQYTYADTHAGGGGEHSSTEVLIDQRNVVCYIKRSGGKF